MKYELEAKLVNKMREYTDTLVAAAKDIPTFRAGAEHTSSSDKTVDPTPTPMSGPSL